MNIKIRSESDSVVRLFGVGVRIRLGFPLCFKNLLRRAKLALCRESEFDFRCRAGRMPLALGFRINDLSSFPIIQFSTNCLSPKDSHLLHSASPRLLSCTFRHLRLLPTFPLSVSDYHHRHNYALRWTVFQSSESARHDEPSGSSRRLRSILLYNNHFALLIF